MSYSAEVLADSPVGYWRLNETSGSTVVDSSGNGLNGSYINSPTLNQSSAITGGRSVLFNGTNQYASIPHNSLINVTELSLECWANWQTTPNDTGQLVGRPVSGSPALRPYQMIRRAGEFEGGYFANNTHNNASLQSVPISTGTWFHYVFTVAISGSTRTVRAYRNGAEVASFSSANAVPVQTTPFFIGAEDNRRFVNAFISEVALYPAALSAARILAHYESAKPKTSRRRRSRSGGGVL
jgi:hypothetical protein